jgi:hypothetical protein
MAKELLPQVDSSDAPELLRLAEEALRTRRAQVLTKGGEALLRVSPAKPARKRSPRRKPIPADDPIWKIIGLVSTEGPDDVGDNKHKYLAEVHYGETQPAEER